MKHLLACLAILVLSQPLSGQGVYTYPQWNPDANYSGFIEASDLLSMLTVFSEPWGFNDTASCSYDGTEFESFFGSVIGGDIVIDSLSVQFILSDVTSPYYLPGCPDAVIDSVQTYFGFTLQPYYIDSESFWYRGDGFNFSVCFDHDFGWYKFSIGFNSAGMLSDYSNDGLYGLNSPIAYPYADSFLYLPFPDSFSFDSTGIHFLPIGSNNWERSGYDGFSTCGYPGSNTSWADYISHWNMIPFWHYAE